jgi:hypothetical protein
MEGMLSTASFFDALQRKMLLDGFMAGADTRPLFGSTQAHSVG